MKLINPPATLEEAIARLTEVTYLLDAARQDNQVWINRAEKAEAEVARLVDGITRCQGTMIVGGNDMYDWGWTKK